MSWKERIQEDKPQTPQKADWRSRIQPESPLSFAQPPIERAPQYGPTEMHTFLESIGQGLTLENLDELKAALETGEMSGPEYERSVSKQRELMALGEEQNPLSSIAGRTIGYVAPATGLGAVARGVGIAPSFARSLGIDVLLGAGQGVGSAESVSEIPQNVALGASMGAALPVASKVVSSQAPKAVSKVNQLLFSLDPEVSQTLIQNPNYIDKVKSTPEIAEMLASSLGQKKKDVAELRRQSFETLGVKPFTGKQSVVQKMEGLPEQFGITTATEAYPEAQAILKEIDMAKQALGQSKTQADIKNILAMLDKRADFQTPSGGQINAVRKNIRGMIDESLKAENPAYREAMAPLAQETSALKRGIKLSGVEQTPLGYVPTDRTTQKIETILNNLERDKYQKAKETVEEVTPGILEEINRTRIGRKAQGGVQAGSRNALLGTILTSGSNELLGGPVPAIVAATVGAAFGGLVDKSGRNIGASVAKNYGRLSKASQAAIDRASGLMKGGNQAATHEFLLMVDPDYQAAIEESVNE